MRPLRQLEVDTFAVGVLMRALAFLFDWDEAEVVVAMVRAWREHEDLDDDDAGDVASVVH